MTKARTFQFQNLKSCKPFLSVHKYFSICIGWSRFLLLWTKQTNKLSIELVQTWFYKKVKLVPRYSLSSIHLISIAVEPSSGYSWSELLPPTSHKFILAMSSPMKKKPAMVAVPPNVLVEICSWNLNPPFTVPAPMEDWD